MAHILRFLAERDEEVVILSLDGVGAFDHVERAAFLNKLESIPELHNIIPLVVALYGTDSQFLWKDDKGVVYTIRQAEGGEQGCPLMPALYALAQHDGLVAANDNLLPNELLLSFLDDLYVVTCRSRAYDAFQEVTTAVEECAGVRTHLGKLRRVWSAGGRGSTT